MALLASLLRHRITIEQPVLVADGQGGYTKSWSPFAMVWARMIPASGSENRNTQQLASEVNYRATVRYRDGITSAMRINWNGRLFNIRTVSDPDGLKINLILIVEEGVAV